MVVHVHMWTLVGHTRPALGYQLRDSAPYWSPSHDNISMSFRLSQGQSNVTDIFNQIKLDASGSSIAQTEY
jgi:hypothetical protein